MTQPGYQPDRFIPGTAEWANGASHEELQAHYARKEQARQQEKIRREVESAFDENGIPRLEEY
jgi:hypothetical protein